MLCKHGCKYIVVSELIVDCNLEALYLPVLDSEYRT
jgi:hypothetical protein